MSTQYSHCIFDDAAAHVAENTKKCLSYSVQQIWKGCDARWNDPDDSDIQPQPRLAGAAHIIEEKLQICTGGSIILRPARLKIVKQKGMKHAASLQAAISHPI
eukprot:4039885-Pleurochrysis_carterae.AAC.1